MRGTVTVMAVYVYEVKHGCTHVETMQCQLLGGGANEGTLVTSRADFEEIRERSRRRWCPTCTVRRAQTW